MSLFLEDCPAALVAQPRERLSVVRDVDGARRFAVDAQPRLLTGFVMPIAPLASKPSAPVASAWRLMAGTTERGFEAAAKHGHQGGRIAGYGAAYVTTNQHFSIRSGPPTCRPPA